MKSATKIYNYIHSLLDWLYPFICVVCEKTLSRRYERIPMCEECRETIKIYQTSFCSICKARIPRGEKNRCHTKEGWKLFAVTDYKDKAVEKSLKAFKYNGVRELETLYSALIEDCISKCKLQTFGKKIRLVPIPLFYRKRNERNFNQSEILVHLLKAALEKERQQDVVVETNLLIRQKNTKPQAEQSKENRLKNVEGCFRLALQTPDNHNNYCGLHRHTLFQQENYAAPQKVCLCSPQDIYIVVDDIYTSGATMNEARRTLKAAGARHVLGFVLALA